MNCTGIGRVASSCGGAREYEKCHVSLYLYFAALITFTCLPLLKIALSKNFKNSLWFLDKRMA